MYQEEVFPCYLVFHENEVVNEHSNDEYILVHRNINGSILTEMDQLLLNSINCHRTLVHFSDQILSKRYGGMLSNPEITKRDQRAESIYSLFDSVILRTEDFFHDENIQ